MMGAWASSACHGHTLGWCEVPYHSWCLGETSYRLSPGSGCGFAWGHMFPAFPKHRDAQAGTETRHSPGHRSWREARFLCQPQCQRGVGTVGLTGPGGLGLDKGYRGSLGQVHSAGQQGEGLRPGWGTSRCHGECANLAASLGFAFAGSTASPRLSPGRVGCPRGWLPGARVRMSCGSAGLGCQRGHNPGVLQTPGVSSSAATDTGARRHTRAFWVDAVSKQTKVELQPTDSPPPATAVSFRLHPPAGWAQESSS